MITRVPYHIAITGTVAGLALCCAHPSGGLISLPLPLYKPILA